MKSEQVAAEAVRAFADAVGRGEFPSLQPLTRHLRRLPARSRSLGVAQRALIQYALFGPAFGGMKNAGNAWACDTMAITQLVRLVARRAKTSDAQSERAKRPRLKSRKVTPEQVAAKIEEHAGSPKAKTNASLDLGVSKSTITRKTSRG